MTDDREMLFRRELFVEKLLSDAATAQN